MSSKARETSCFQPRVAFPPSPLHSDSTSDSTSTRLFFWRRDPPVSDLSHRFRFETRTPSTAHESFWAAQWSQLFWRTPSGGQTQYSWCRMHRSQDRSPLVPENSTYSVFSSGTYSGQVRYSPLCPCR